MKKVKSLHIATLILSFLAELYGVYSLLNGGDSIEAICWIIGGFILGYNDWKIFLTKNKS
jgi:hypothetical protein